MHRPLGHDCDFTHAGPMPVSQHPTVDPDAPLAVRAFHALRDVTRMQKQLMLRRIGEKGAHPGQAFSLWMLSEHDGMSQAELAQVLHVSRPTVTIMVQKMEGAGLIERRTDADDKRVVRLYVTESGRTLQAHFREVHDSLVDDTIAPLSEDDQRELERILGLIRDNLHEAAERSQKGTT